MLAITIDETISAVTITNRALPSVLQVVFSLATTSFLAFGIYMTLPDILNGGGSWLPPLDQLSDNWKTTILSVCIVASFAITIAPLVIGVRTLFFARVWRFDAQGHTITRNGERIGALDDCKEVVIEGDFCGDTDTIEFILLMKSGRKIMLAQGTNYEAQLRRFLEAAKAIFSRTQIPYRKAGIPAWGSRGKFPTWWTALN
jgi:hypothetical protein